MQKARFRIGALRLKKGVAHAALGNSECALPALAKGQIPRHKGFPKKKSDLRRFSWNKQNASDFTHRVLVLGKLAHALPFGMAEERLPMLFV
jgi:hypothetical protein